MSLLHLAGRPSEEAGHYFVPAFSYYPALLAGGIFLLMLGFIETINGFDKGRWVMVFGAGLILWVLVGWLGSVIAESRQGDYGRLEDGSFRWGMIWFIASEVVFFSTFFGALFYLRVIAVPELGHMEAEHGATLWPGYAGGWPTSGPRGANFTPMEAWGIPAINTALLLSSGATITWAHWGLLKERRWQLIAGLTATVLLGVTFLVLQGWEYRHAYHELGLTLGAGAYGATFFMLTGFHGLHVTLGAIMLSVILARSIHGDFSPRDHFAFEGVAWYWHFVDVVWLMLFVFVYWL
jgi:cytochrome c oxidase subunit 3